MWIRDQFFAILNIGRWALYTIYAYSPEGDSAAALAEIALCEYSCSQ